MKNVATDKKNQNSKQIVCKMSSLYINSRLCYIIHYILLDYNTCSHWIGERVWREIGLHCWSKITSTEPGGYTGFLLGGAKDFFGAPPELTSPWEDKNSTKSMRKSEYIGIWNMNILSLKKDTYQGMWAPD